MKTYKASDLTWGFELELSNVPKDSVIPENLGKWEYCECDIINTKGKFKNVCADPLGKNPGVGGEINTKPTKTYEEQVDRIMEIIDLFEEYEPDSGMTAHSHIHVCIKDIENNIQALQKLVLCYYLNQEKLFDFVYPYDDSIIKDKKKYSKVCSYLKYDGARRMPEWKVLQLKSDKIKTVEDFIAAYAVGKDGITPCRPVRYGVNFLTLKHSKTIEFRCFRGSVKREELMDSFEFVQKFVLRGLNKPERNLIDIINSKRWKFPPMIFDEGQADGWLKTKHHLELTKNKNRVYWNVE